MCVFPGAGTESARKVLSNIIDIMNIILHIMIITLIIINIVILIIVTYINSRSIIIINISDIAISII